MKHIEHRLAFGLVVGVISLLLLAATAATPSNEPSAPGRFQVVAGHTVMLGMTKEGPATTEMPVIIKIDTATGDAWRLQLLNNNGKSLDSWKPISNTASKP